MKRPGRPSDVLVVDDTLANLQLLTGILTEAGYVVRSAPNGKLALRFVAQFPPDLILLDIRMPDLDGYEVCRQLKANPSFHEIPVIFLSALNESADKVLGFSIGAVDYITKPFYTEEVLMRVETHLKLRELQMQLTAQNAALQALNADLEKKVAERTAELRESEETARALLNAPTDAAALVDLTGRVLDLNSTLLQRWGQSRDYVIGQSLWDWLPEEIAVGRRARIVQVVESAADVRFEDEFQGRWEDHVFYPVRDAGGRISKVAMLSRDVTERKRAEQALREAHAHLRVTLDALPDLLFELDRRGNIHDFHAPRRDLIFVSPEDLIGQTLDQALPTVSAQIVLAAVERAVQEGRHTGVICSMETPLGLRWFELSIAALGNSNEADPRLIVLARDISERKWAEEEVSRLVSVVEQATEAVLIMDLDGKVIYANPCFELHSGYRVHEVLGEDWQKLQGDLLEEAFWTELWETVKAGKTWSGTLINRRKDGSLYYEAAAVFPIRTPQGEIINYAAVKRDISEQVRAQRDREQLLVQIQEQAYRVQRIIDSVPEGVLLLDAGMTVQLVNPLGRKDLATLTKLEVGERLDMLGNRPLAELLTSPPRGLWHEVEWERRTFQVIAEPMEMGPTSQGWVLVIRDVTQQREIDRRVQQQERLAVVGQMAAGIAHDFNNILAAIVLYSQLAAQSEGITPQGRSRMETVTQQAMHATRLIQQILDFSRSSFFDRGPLDLLPLLKEQCKLLERTMPDNIRVSLDYEEGEYRVLGDPTRLQQVFMNLAVNARDAMPEGGILHFHMKHLQIAHGRDVPLPEMHLREDGGLGGWVRVDVSDTGYGIPPEVLPHIYEPFFTTKAPGRGTGLGLPQVHGIVTAHDGYIDVVSQSGKGTVFSVYFRFHREDPLPMEPVRAYPLVQGHGERVLIVEDNATTRQALVESLAVLGYQVLTAQNGREALEVLTLHAGEIRLVLSDLVMPEMGGEALFHALRRRQEPVKMVILTGHLVDGGLRQLEALGLAGWMFKPPDLMQLGELLARVLAD